MKVSKYSIIWVVFVPHHSTLSIHSYSSSGKEEMGEATNLVTQNFGRRRGVSVHCLFKIEKKVEGVGGAETYHNQQNNNCWPWHAGLGRREGNRRQVSGEKAPTTLWWAVWGLVISMSWRRGEKRGKKKKSLTSLESAVLTFTSGTSDEFWEVETDLKRKSLTLAANQGKPLRVLKADVEGNLALGGGDHVRVGQAYLKLQVVLGVIAKTISGWKSMTKNFENWFWGELTVDVDPTPTQMGFQSASQDIVTFD